VPPETDSFGAESPDDAAMAEAFRAGFAEDASAANDGGNGGGSYADEAAIESQQFIQQGQRSPGGNAPAPGSRAGGEQEVQPTIEQLQAQLAERQAYERTLNGRLSAADRENIALRQRLAQSSAPMQQPVTQPPARQDEDDPDDPLTNAPDLERAVNKRVQRATRALEAELQQSRAQLAQVDAELRTTQQVVQPMQQAQRDNLIRDTHAAMDEQFGPAWRDAVRSDSYAAWLDEQPDFMQRAASEAVTPKQTASILKHFFSDVGFPQGAQQPQQQQSRGNAGGYGNGAGQRPTGTQQNQPQRPATQRLPQQYARAGGFIPSRPAPQRPAMDSEQALDAAFAAGFRDP
jgi:hypothetical protein